MRANTFIGNTLQGIVSAMARALEAEELAKKSGLLQRLDPRVKLLGLAGLIVAAAASRRLSVIVGIFVMAVLMAIASRIPIRVLCVRVWMGVLVFTSIIGVPALFTTPGQPVAGISPFGLPITHQGLRSAMYLITRTETAATLAVLLVLSTRWTELLKALRSLWLPATLVTIIGMTHRYIFLLLETAQDMFQSRQSRSVGMLEGPQRRRLATRTAGVLMDKSLQLSNDVYMAMRSRGFSGELGTLSQFSLRAADYVALTVFISATAAALWAGR